MATITLHGNPFNTSGELPETGTQAPAFALTNTDLSPLTHSGAEAVRLVLNIFPSVDTPVCATSVRKFNELAASLPNTKVLCVSMDLPFALGRFCGAEDISNVSALSSFRNPEFGVKFGLTITNGPLSGLLARAVVVIDANNKIIYSQLVPEIAQEPDYQAALSALGA